jgi:tetratricopeptide (TPR) repeat protein
MRSSRRLGLAGRHLVVLSILASLALPASASQAKGWREDFKGEAKVKAAGELQGKVKWHLESFSPVKLEASNTAEFQLTRRPGVAGREEPGPQVKARPGVDGPAVREEFQLSFVDTVPALVPNDPGEEHFYKRSEGAISALGWVDQRFADVLVSGDVNTAGKPSVSRQGLMARWDQSNNFYWFHVDYSIGEFGILRGRYFGVLKPVEGSFGKIRDFDNTKSYHLEFELVGNKLRGKVYDAALGRGNKALVGDTGVVGDPDPWLEGVSGFLVEAALKEPFTPLEGSVANIEAAPIGKRLAESQQDAAAAKAAGNADAEYRRAVNLRNAGNLKKAIDQYYKVLRIKPDHVPALNDLAWIRATSADPKIRAPREAIDLSAKAFSLLVFNRPAHAPVGLDMDLETKLLVVRVGNTVAAAHAAAGIFEPIVSESLVTKFASGEYTPAKATDAQAREAEADSEYTICGDTAAELSAQAIEDIHRTSPSEETENLLAATLRYKEKIEKREDLIGEAQQ